MEEEKERILGVVYTGDILYSALYAIDHYVVFTPVKDTFDCSVLKNIVACYEGIKILLVSPKISSIRYKFIQEIGLKIGLLPKSVNKGHLEGMIGENEFMVLMGIGHYLGESVFTPRVAKNEYTEVGRVGKVPVFQEDITNFMHQGGEILEWIGRHSEDPVFEILRLPQTAPGREALRAWLSFPERRIEEIERKHVLCRRLCPFVMPLQRILSRCKCSPVRSPQDLDRLRTNIQAAKEASRLIGSIICFKNEESYNILIEMLNTVQSGHIREGIDRHLDSLRNTLHTLPLKLNRIAQEIADSTGCVLTVVYFPQIGFFVESESEIGEIQFSLASSHYYKTQEMKALDEEVGDIETLVYERESDLINKIFTEIEKITLKYLNEYIGSIDAYCSAISYSQKYSCTFPTFSPTNELAFGLLTLRQESLVNILSEASFGGKCILQSGKKEVLPLIGAMIIFAQAGMSLPFSDVTLPLFDCLLYKPEKSESLQAGQSTFVAEMLATKSLVESCNDKSICLIENLGRGTTQSAGLAIFLGITSYIQSKLLIASTFYRLGNLEDSGILVHSNKRGHLKSLLQENYSFYVVDEKSIIKLSDYTDLTLQTEPLQFNSQWNPIVRQATERILHHKKKAENGWAKGIVKRFVDNELCYEDNKENILDDE